MKTKQTIVHRNNQLYSADVNTHAAIGQGSGIAKATVYGYIRVSTREQNEARQVDAMKQFGVDCMLMDKQSGKDFDRPAYQRLLEELRPGDVLVVKSIDRLGKNYSDILEQWRIITKEKEAAIVVLDMPLLDTRSNRDLTGTLIADIVLQLLSYVAKTERAFIKQRQREGIAAAKARGQRFGPPCKERPEKLDDYINKWAAGEISAREASRKLHVAHTTFLTWAREVMEKKGYIHCEKGMRPVAPGAARN
jgi:DNA invertase Pin-like site-specific DNA recombinase